MPRRKIFRTNRYPYHLTARLNNRDEFPIPLQLAWKLISSELYCQTILHSLEIHAFVLMPNHFHLVARTREIPIDQVMRSFMCATTRIVNKASSRSGHLFGSRYHWGLISNPLYYAHATKYVYRNPVKASLISNVEDWPYGSLSGLIGGSKLPFPLAHHGSKIHSLIPEEISERINWMNHAYDSAESEAIRLALKRKEFKLPRKKSGNNFRIASSI